MASYTTTHGIKDLTDSSGIESAVFVKWVVTGLGTTLLSDYDQSTTIDGDTYESIGNLLSVTAPRSELRASPAELTITISGIPTDSVTDVLNSDIKGSTIKVSRIYEDHQSSASGSFVIFNGIVTNYSITDSVEPGSKTAATVIALTVNNIVEILNRKTNGRKTHPQDFLDQTGSIDSVMFDLTAILKDKDLQIGAPNK